VTGTGSRHTHFVWIDRAGRAGDSFDVALAGAQFVASPDGKRLVLAGRDGPLVRLATYDLTQKTLTPLAEYRQEFPNGPIWLADGRQVLVGRYGIRKGELVTIDVEANAPPQSRLKTAGTWVSPSSISRDGRYAMFSVLDAKTRSQDLWVLDFGSAGGPPQARPFLATAATETEAALSPDGQWVAYSSDETGAFEIYARRFPSGEGKRRISALTGRTPRWSDSGRELFFITANGQKMMTVDVASGSTLTLGEPRSLFEGHFVVGADLPAFVVSPDAGRFLMTQAESSPSELVIVQHWFEEVKKLTATRGSQ
jgi:hypothetical protein